MIRVRDRRISGTIAASSPPVVRQNRRRRAPSQKALLLDFVDTGVVVTACTDHEIPSPALFEIVPLAAQKLKNDGRWLL